MFGSPHLRLGFRFRSNPLRRLRNSMFLSQGPIHSRTVGSDYPQRLTGYLSTLGAFLDRNRSCIPLELLMENRPCW